MNTPLRVAPCPACQRPVVFGQPGCPACAQVFAYGPTPPPQPTAAQVHQALSAFYASQPTAQPAPRPQPAQPAPHAAPRTPQAPQPQVQSFVDTGRFDDQQVNVTPEVIPGLIDSTLYARFSPDEVAAGTMPGLELNNNDAIPAAAGVMPGLEQTEFSAAGPVREEQIPGLIDSTLYAKFTPDTVDAPAIAGLDVNPRAGLLSDEGEAVDEEQACTDCGHVHDRPTCPACGARRRSE